MDQLFESESFRRRLAETIAWCSPRLEKSYAENRVRMWRSRDPEPEEVMIPMDVDTMFRSPELRPARHELYDEGWTNGWSNTTRGGPDLEWSPVPQAEATSDRRERVDMLAEIRSRYLYEQKRYPEAAGSDLQGGRLLGYAPDHTLCEGASGGETEGYLDDCDMPPWDSWIWYWSDSKSDHLISWVPAPLIPVVTGGMVVNSSDCIFWLDEQPGFDR